MKKLLGLFFLLFCQLRSEFKYIPFDDAMRMTRNYSSVVDVRALFENTTRVIGIDGYKLYNFFYDLYEKNKPTNIVYSDTPKIPKIIHQIWLGSDVPQVLQEYMDSWIEYHLGPEWQYILWTDTEILQLQLYNQEFYDLTDNYGMKSDIARWEILYRYGGVYIDADFECLQPLDIFHHCYDFYVGLQPLDTSLLQLNNALVGARPGHPILIECIKKIKENSHRKGVPQKTGPVHLTRCFFTTADKCATIDIALPAFYFYPLGCLERYEDIISWKKQGAYGVHWWAKSWMPKRYRKARFRSIDNEETVQNWNE